MAARKSAKYMKKGSQDVGMNAGTTYDNRTVKEKSEDWYSAATRDKSDKSLGRKVQKAQRVDKADRKVVDGKRQEKKLVSYGVRDTDKGITKGMSKGAKKTTRIAKKGAKKARKSY